MDSKNRTLNLQKNQSVRLDANTEMTFLYHSHKRTSANQKSPLVTYIKYQKNGKVEEKQYNLYFEDEKKTGWQWNNYVFIVTDYDYDNNITVIAYSEDLEQFKNETDLIIWDE